MDSSTHGAGAQGPIRGPVCPSLLKAAAVIPLLCVAMPALAGPKPPVKSAQAVPEISLSFDSLKIPGISQSMLAAGGSMMTVNFLDQDHLLVTYGSRDLVPRIADDPREDEDRIVAGELVELPTGKVLASTRWRMHDHGRYLWSLGEGRFLLREGQALSTLAPLANLHTPDPFSRVAFPYRNGTLDAVVVSADNRLLTLETHPKEKKKLTGIDINLLTHNGDPMPKPSLYLDFFRMEGSGTEAAPLVAKHQGTVRSDRPLRLPLDGDGYLVSSGGKRGRWPVEFEAFGGKAMPVGMVESNCQPGLELLSPTQWLAFTCHGANSDAMTLAAYDFAKHEIWEEPMGTFESSPAFALAPDASRFAISRRLETVANTGGAVSQGDASGSAQEVRVYATQTGDLLLKLNCTPSFRTFENFDLSPDGMRLVVVRNGALEVYRLPELTKQDREDLAELHKLLPPHSDGQINLRRLGRSENQTDPTIAESEIDGSSAATLAGASATGAATAPTIATTPAIPSQTASTTPASESQPSPAGDDTPTHRKPPTLLNPGEKPEMKIKGQKPSSEPP